MNETALEIVSGRRNPMIDPTLSIWGWEIPVYLFLGGLVAGLFVLSAAWELRARERPSAFVLRAAPFLALLLVSLGMGALFLDLEHKTHVYRFYLPLRPTSPMSWGAWILVLVYPAGLLVGLGSLSEAARARFLASAWSRRLFLRGLFTRLCTFADAHRRAILWTAVVAGVLLGVYTGLLLGTLAARPAWSSAVLGPLFLASGLSAAAALLLLFPLGERERHTFARWDLFAIGAELVLLALLLLGFAAGGRAAQSAAALFLGGPWTAVFWSVVVAMGLVVPLLMEATELRRRLPFAALTPVLVLLGGLALRFVIVGAGQASSLAIP